MTDLAVAVSVTDSAGLKATASSTITVTTATTTINIGETNILAATDGGNGNLLLAQPVTLPQAAAPQSLSFYVDAGGVVGKLRLGLYADAGGKPGTKTAETAEFTPVAGWNTKPTIASSTLQPGSYWLAYFPQSNGLVFRVVTGGIVHRWAAMTYGALPATFPTTGGGGAAHWSLYGTFSVGPPPPPDTTKPSIPTNLTATIT